MARASVGKVATALMVLCCVILVAQATDVAWTFNVAGWENGKSFKAGDVLVFKYTRGAHNVVQVDQTGYNECKPGGGQVHNTGNDQITLRRGRNFFICSIPGHCQKPGNMRIAVNAK